MKIVNKAVSAGALRHRKFKNFLSENESTINDISKMKQVRWLSTNKTFTQILEVLPLLKEFLVSENIIFDELNDTIWIDDLTFLTDLTNKLSILNKSLQGKIF